ncbi:hypothetical protein BDB01DRAFT_849975 [Pilobolus umbonatus]|nr:hypothetical protein BDB01DRAFT_849975 [Pilobolus umbonatus]
MYHSNQIRDINEVRKAITDILEKEYEPSPDYILPPLPGPPDDLPVFNIERHYIIKEVKESQPEGMTTCNDRKRSSTTQYPPVEKKQKVSTPKEEYTVSSKENIKTPNAIKQLRRKTMMKSPTVEDQPEQTPPLQIIKSLFQTASSHGKQPNALNSAQQRFLQREEFVFPDTTEEFGLVEKRFLKSMHEHAHQSEDEHGSITGTESPIHPADSSRRMGNPAKTTSPHQITTPCSSHQISTTPYQISTTNIPYQTSTTSNPDRSNNKITDNKKALLHEKTEFDDESSPSPTITSDDKPLKSRIVHPPINWENPLRRASIAPMFKDNPLRKSLLSTATGNPLRKSTQSPVRDNPLRRKSSQSSSFKENPLRRMTRSPLMKENPLRRHSILNENPLRRMTIQKHIHKENPLGTNKRESISQDQIPLDSSSMKPSASKEFYKEESLSSYKKELPSSSKNESISSYKQELPSSSKKESPSYKNESLSSKKELPSSSKKESIPLNDDKSPAHPPSAEKYNIHHSPADSPQFHSSDYNSQFDFLKDIHMNLMSEPQFSDTDSQFESIFNRDEEYNNFEDIDTQFNSIKDHEEDTNFEEIESDDAVSNPSSHLFQDMRSELHVDEEEPPWSGQLNSLLDTPSTAFRSPIRSNRYISPLRPVSTPPRQIQLALRGPSPQEDDMNPARRLYRRMHLNEFSPIRKLYDPEPFSSPLDPEYSQ